MHNFRNLAAKKALGLCRPCSIVLPGSSPHAIYADSIKGRDVGAMYMLNFISSPEELFLPTYMRESLIFKDIKTYIGFEVRNIILSL